MNDTATTENYTYLHTLSLHDALPIAYASGPARANIERFAEFKRDGQLQPDVDPFVGAMLAVSGELAALMVMQTAKTPEEESELIRRFSITYHRLLFHGILNQIG